MRDEKRPVAKKAWSKPEIWTMKLNKREIRALFGKSDQSEEPGSAAA